MDFGDTFKQIKRSDMIALRKALESGLDPNLHEGDGASFLMIAALEGRTDVGRLLIELGADVNYVGPVDRVLTSALECAIHNAHPKFVRLLLQNGASQTSARLEREQGVVSKTLQQHGGHSR